MKAVYLFIFFLSSYSLHAQCERSDYREIIRLATEDIQNRIYQRAINRLLDARDICPDEREAVNLLIKQTFEQIEAEKEKTDRVLDKIYFYADKFALTAGRDPYSFEGPAYKYGYIDKEGQVVIPYSFEQATPFQESDGFARVRKNMQKFLLDTTGTTYLLAESMEELTEETEALDLSNVEYEEQMMEQVVRYPQLKILIMNSYLLGWLPEGIDQLQDLEYLIMHNHYLMALSPKIGSLSKLRVLDLQNASYTSLYDDDWTFTLPAELGNLTSLCKLDLSNMKLATLPSNLGKLVDLEELDLSGNDLTEIPASIKNLSQLTFLNLNYNQLSTIPEELSHIGTMKELWLMGNQLTSLPSNIGNLSQLKELYLSDNQFSEIPEVWAELTHLQLVDLSNNQLRSLSASLLDIPSLEYISIGQNRIESLPAEICTFATRWNQSAEESPLYLWPNPLKNIPDCVLSVLHPYELQQIALKSLKDGLYSQAYRSVQQLENRQVMPAQVKKEIKAELLRLKEEGISHPDLAKIRALLSQ